MGVEEGFFLDGIALGSGGISPGNIEFAAAIEADFANPGLALGDGTTVTAGEAAEAIVVEFLVKRGIGFADAFVEDGAKGGHCFYFNSAEGFRISVSRMQSNEDREASTPR